MIDINELRRRALDGDLLAVQELLDRLEAWENIFGHLGRPDEVGNGWHALSVRLEAAERAWKESDKACRDLTEKVIPNIREQLEAAEKERDTLRAALQHEADCVEAAKAEIEALRAKIAKMEKQEPARLVTATAYRWRYRGAVKWQYGELTEEVARLAKEHNHEVQALGILPGAQGEEK